MLINFSDVTFIKSCPLIDDAPSPRLPEVAFFGRSNVGKSSLINSLCGKQIAFKSKKAGKTRLLNYFLVDKTFYLVDAPGFGFTLRGSELDQNFSSMMEGYLTHVDLKVVLVLADVRRGVKEDELSLLRLAKKKGIRSILVYTKADNAKQGELALALQEGQIAGADAVFLSNPNKHNISELRSLVAKALSNR